MTDSNEQDKVIVPAPESNDQANGTQKIEQVQVTAPQSGNEDAERTQPTGNVSPDHGQNAEPTKEDLDRRAEMGKISALERERNQLRDESEKVLRSLNPIFQNDPAAYERWRQGIIKEGIPDPGTHESLYGAQGRQVQGYQQNNPQQGYRDPNAQYGNQPPQEYEPNVSYQGQPNIQPQGQNVGPADIQRMVDQRLEDQQGWREFIQDVPEMDPKNLQTDEDRARARDTWNKVSWMATTMKSLYPHMSTGETFKAAYNSLPNNQQESYQKGYQVGEMSGRQSAYVSGAGNSSVSSAKPSSGEGQSLTVNMTKAQKEHYDRLRQSKGQKLADLYARNVAAL